MAIINQNLLKYIQSSSKQGYDENSIRAALKVNGYSDKEINSAFNYIHKTKKTPKKTKILIKIAIVLTIIIILIATVLLFLNKTEKSNTQRITLKTTTSTNIDSTTSTEERKKIIEEKINTGDSELTKFQKLEFYSTIDNKEYNIIKTKETSNQNQLEGNSILNKMNYILNEKDAKKALELCTYFDEIKDSDICYRKIAEKFNNHNFCERISTPIKTDLCYQDFILKGNKELCNKIKTEDLQKNCKT